VRGAPEHPEYLATETLHQGGCTALLRALRAGDRRPVILKVVDPRRCRDRDLERLRLEHENGASLDLPAVVRPLGLETYEGMPALVLEDFGGRPLERALGAPTPVGSFLDLAVRIARAVADLHEAGIIHKDLKPANILVHPATSEVKLVDLGIATRLPREQQGARPPQLIEGSLPYISPEQTGRMNRVLDSRSDLYSLGVTFYQMLTGRLPFEARDPLEWVHCHVAREPAPPSRLVPEVPEAIERIVLKLLAKMPDDRYQTASGLELDLARCLDAWRRDGRVEPFALGEHDVPDHLQIPQKLYGREQQVAALVGAFERVADTGIPELVLVAGYSGIGKSALAHELQKPIVRRGGVFVAGKFDQHRRDVPYSTIAQALRELVLDLLAEGEEQVARWRERLQAALGSNGQLVVDVIPQVELLVGRQPPVPELPPTEALSRFQMVFRRFVEAFAWKEHPLTLFVDDLQWADPASLALLQDLVTYPDVRSLLVVGAYRDNEVTGSRPLASAVESARRAGARVSDVVLGPLSDEHVTAFLADALHCAPREAEPLADLVREKTGANPFFVIQFLTVLYRQGLVAFDRGAARWRWDVEQIRAQGYTDNVFELMAGKLRHLPVETREALAVAACVGASVEAGTLAAVCQRDPEEALRPALEEDLLARLESTYRFPHDRVQEAAYALIPEGERPAVHLAIGRRLLARAAPERVEEEIFEIVNQFDRGAALIASPAERERVAELNLVAGKRARRSTAYASALKYLAAGRELLGEDCWSRRYELAFALEIHRAECEYLTGALEAAEERLSMLWDRAGNLADLAALTRLRLDLYTTLDQSDRGVSACLDYLRRLGIQWSPHPTWEEVHREHERIWQQLGSRPIEALVDSPPMSDPDWLATMDVLTSLMPPALFTDENLLCLLIGRMVNLSLERGLCDGSSLAYVWLGMILGPYFGDFRAAFRFGKVSLELVEKRGLDRFKARVYLCFANFVNPWARHVVTSADLQRRAFDAAMRIGDLTFAAYSNNSLITILLAAGEPLGDVQREAERGLAFARDMGFGQAVDIMATQLGLIRTLRGLTARFSSFDDGQFDEGRFERHLETDPRLAIATCWYWIRKLQSRVFAGDATGAVEAASKAERLIWTSRSFFEVAEYVYYGAIARAGRHDAAPAEERPRHLAALVAHLEQLEVWAENCPENFQDRHALVSAELARIEGRELEAERLYEQAIRSARENGFVHDEALAHELAAKFYRARGYERFADLYLREARACYLRWGADGKVRELERLHPQLVERRPFAPAATIAVRAEQLDLLAVVKASQTVSGEMDIDKLVGTLLGLALELGGARKAALVLARGSDLSIEAQASLENGATTRMRPAASVESSALLPASVLHRVRRTREPVIIDDVAGDRFAADPYFAAHRTRSILCLPIVRDDLVGLLYLENDLAAGAFTPDRLTALSLLASQAAISVENARLLLELRERETRIRRLVESDIIGIFFWRLDGAVTQANDALLDMVGYGREDLLSGRVSWADMTPPEYRGADERAIAELKAMGSCRPYEKEYLHKDGHRVPVLLGGASFEGRGDEGVAFVLDLTERRRAEAKARAYEVERSRAEALAELDRAKTAFFSNVSHEFRTPLTLALGPLETLLDPRSELPAGDREQLAMAHRNCLKVARLVNALLDFSRIEAGRAQARYEPTDLARLTADVASSFRSACGRAGLALRVDCVPLPAPVYVDRDMWEQIVLNLLSNAFKFTLDGGIEVELRAAGDGCELSVRDTGLGIPEAELPRVFERFHRVGQAGARTLEGTGIGLALVQELAKLHGGSVKAESAVGKGSTFIVAVPFGTAHLPAERIGAAREQSQGLGARPYVEEALRWIPPGERDGAREEEGEIARPAAAGADEGAPARREERRRGARPRVLFADDNADMRDYVRRLLARRYDVEVVADGRAALEAARRARPALVLSDVMMPRLDGFALLQELRADPGLRTVPVVLLSARASEETLVWGLETGADDYLVKPFSAKELLARVTANLELARFREEVESERAARAAAERADQRKSDFIAVLSHELRNPLAPIRMGIQLLRRSPAEGPVAERAKEIIEHQTQHLSRLVDDLLDLTRISRGKIELQTARIDPQEVALSTCDDLRSLFEQAGVALRFERAREQIWVEADATRLAQVLGNLLHNATKFTPAGGSVTVEVAVREGRAELSVRDTGIGMEPGEVGQMFEPFAQAAQGLARTQGGLGLGLPLAKGLVELHGGSLRARSEGPGRGSEFVVTLPLARDPAEEPGDLGVPRPCREGTLPRLGLAPGVPR
jgi:PAS domain S-box-containing protein